MKMQRLFAVCISEVYLSEGVCFAISHEHVRIRLLEEVCVDVRRHTLFDDRVCRHVCKVLVNMYMYLLLGVVFEHRSGRGERSCSNLRTC